MILEAQEVEQLAANNKLGGLIPPLCWNLLGQDMELSVFACKTVGNRMCET